TGALNVALQRWEEGNAKGANELLSAQVPKKSEPDRRGFEWRYLWNLCRDETHQVIACDGESPARRLVTSPNHHLIVTYGDRAAHRSLYLGIHASRPAS